jgi:DNA-binding CsgD family transcriptional regulator
MTATDMTHPISIPRPDGLRPLSAVAVHLSMAADNCGEDGLSYLVLISDPDHGIGLNRERLQQIYGLTPAEARLATLLVEGKRLRTAAADLEISFETARTHLKRIFSKTNSESQADLVRLLLNLANQITSST